MDMDQFVQGIAERFMQLPEEDKNKIRSFKQTEEAQLIAYVLGPELTSVIDRLGPPTEPQQEPPAEPMMQEPMMEQPPRRPGLGARV